MSRPTHLDERGLTRRGILRLGAGGLLAAGAVSAPSPARAAPDQPDFSFLVVNDLHYQDERCGRWLDGAVRRMKAVPDRPAFCLVLGDLTEDGSAEDLAAVGKVLEGLGMPVHAVIGNHDYGPKDDRSTWDRLRPGSLNYEFEHRGWRFVGLDTTDGLRYQNTAVQPHTLRWLDEALPRIDREQPLAVFTHFPLGADVTYRPAGAEELLGRFARHRLRAVFSGHFHAFTERRAGDAVLTTNRCCAFSRSNHDGSKAKGFFVCRAREGALQREFVEVPL